MHELAHLTLAEASAHLHARKASALELTEACLAQILLWQPKINAFLRVDVEAAIAAAKASDRRRHSRRARGRLDGVPVAHKDIFARTGRVVTAGSIILDQPAAGTATVLRKLDAAGAIELGSLHLSEFAAGATGHNRHYGTCRNPWNRDRTPGGSSGGSAAALAAGLAFGSLGTDTGGSLRLPAHFCGVAALRPTYGRVSRAGVFPRAWSMDTVGPIARTVEDLSLLFDVIRGPDVNDATTARQRMARKAPRLEQTIRGKRIGIPRNFFYDQLHAGIGTLIEASLADLRRLGARLVPIDVPDPQLAFELAQIIAKVEAVAIHERWLPARRMEYDHGIVDGMAAGEHVRAVDYLRALRQRGAMLQTWLDQVFSAADLLVTPVYERPTPRLDACAPHDAAAVASIMATFGRCTRPFSYLGLPALAVPCGFWTDGLPAAFQLVARPFEEASLLSAGHLYQKATAWHTRRPALSEQQRVFG